jgi:O-antigen ligase
MLKKVLSTTVEPIAYTILFLLTIYRITWGGSRSLEEQPFQEILPEMILWVLLLLSFLWIANRRSNIQNMLSAWGKNWVLLIFILFALCSIVWSSNTYASIYNGIILIGCSAIAAYTGLAHRDNSLFRGFWWFSAVVAIFTFLVAWLNPSVGTHIGYPYYGAWRGIFWSKNYMGPIMAFGNLVFLFNIASSGKKFWPLLGNILFYFLTALLVFLSKCATAEILFVLLNLGFLLAFAWVKWKKFLKKAHYVGLAITFVLLLILIFLNLNFLFGLLNRNATLTGRLPLWSYLIQNGLANRPVLGNGFGATWESNNFRSTTQAAVKWDLPPLVADNGYIDIFLDLGLVGVVLSIFMVLLCLFRVSRHAFKEQTVISFFPVLVMVFVITVNLDLSFFLNLESFAWFLMIFALFSTTPFPQGNKERKMVY